MFCGAVGICGTMVPQMPTAPQNTKNYFLVDPIYWADNGTELGEKWEAMKAGL